MPAAALLFSCTSTCVSKHALLSVRLALTLFVSTLNLLLIVVMTFSIYSISLIPWSTQEPEEQCHQGRFHNCGKQQQQQQQKHQQQHTKECETCVGGWCTLIDGNGAGQHEAIIMIPVMQLLLWINPERHNTNSTLPALHGAESASPDANLLRYAAVPS